MYSRKHVPTGYLPEQLEKDPIQALMQSGHRSRLEAASPHITLSAPDSIDLPHLKRNAKAEAMKQQRKAEIDRDNFTLLARMNHILTHKSMDDSTEHLRKLGKRMERNMRTAERTRQKAIQRENESMSRRIASIRPVYDRRLLRKEEKITSCFVNPVRPGTLWALGPRVTKKAAAERAAMGSSANRKRPGTTSGASRSSLSRSGSHTLSHPSIRERGLTSSHHSRRPRNLAMSSPMVVPVASVSGSAEDELEPDEAMFYHSSDMFLAPEVLERRRSEFLMPRKKGGSPFVGRDMVLGRTRRLVTHSPADSEPLKTRKQVAGLSTSPIHARSPSLSRGASGTSSGASPSAAKFSAAAGDFSDLLAPSPSRAATPGGAGASVPGETWELSVVEVGHLSRTQDDLMLGLKVAGVRASDGAQAQFDLDIDLLKGLTQRFDKPAYLTLTSAKRAKDESMDLPVYRRLSTVPPTSTTSTGAVDESGAERHRFLLGRLVKFILDRVILSDDVGRIEGPSLAFYTRK